MSELKIHRISQVVADLVDYLDVFQHDLMQVLFRASSQGGMLETMMREAFGARVSDLSDTEREKYQRKLQRAYGVVLDQFGHVGSRIRTGDWIDATYMPVGPDTFMIATSIYQIRDMVRMANTLATSVYTTMLTAEFYLGAELKVLEDYGMGEDDLLQIVEGVIHHRPIEMMAHEGESEDAYLQRVRDMTEVRTDIHGKLHELIHVASAGHDVKASIKNRICTISMYPYDRAPAF